MNRKTIVLVAVIAVGVLCVPIGALAAARLTNDQGRDEMVTEVIRQAPAGQQVQLSDGEASDGEQLAAAERTAQCLRDAGVNVVMTPERGPGQFRYGGGTYEEQQRANALYTECYDRLQREIDIVHSLQQVPLEQSKRALAEEALLQCLRDQGVAVELSAPKEVWWELRLSSPTEFAKCGDAVIAEFGAMP